MNKDERIKKCMDLSNEVRRLSFDIPKDDPTRYFYEQLGTILTYLRHLENYGKVKNVTVKLSSHAKQLHEIAKEIRGLSH